ncbi:hypothetical protein NKH99_31245 [Mesorhizobium sp. M0854]|uniref:hypothetical protein n=1 Tax=Mesorhizobium sp. M0854 TaxID=2957013 RepID=UPI00333A837A
MEIAYKLLEKDETRVLRDTRLLENYKKLKLLFEARVDDGLVAFNTAPGLMSLDLQRRLFLLALSELGGEEAWNEVLEITVDVERSVTIERFNRPD